MSNEICSCCRPGQKRRFFPIVRSSARVVDTSLDHSTFVSQRIEEQRTKIILSNNRQTKSFRENANITSSVNLGTFMHFYFFALFRRSRLTFPLLNKTFGKIFDSSRFMLINIRRDKNVVESFHESFIRKHDRLSV